MLPTGTNEIITDRLILRRMTLDDIPYIYKNWTSDPLVSRYVLWNMHTNIEDTVRYVKYKIEKYSNPYNYDFVVCLKENNEPIGEIDAVMVSINDDLIEMGDCYGSKYWNKGYGTEALKAFIDYMFKEAKVAKIMARHKSTNSASGRIMQKANMKYDGILRGYSIDKVTKERCDLVYYSIDNPYTLV